MFIRAPAAVSNDTYINAGCVCELLRRLASLEPLMPITPVLENARYQKCRLVQALAEALHIELLFLPPYSPDPDPIERLWKFVKRYSHPSSSTCAWLHLGLRYAVRITT